MQTAIGTGYASAQAQNNYPQPAQPKENTQLETHLYALQSLQETLGNVAGRAMVLADRLLGSEPAPLQGAQQNTKDPVQPPLLIRIEHALLMVAELAQSVQRHVGRLERL